MNTLELALKKQRLQIAGAGLRSDIARHSIGLAPIFTGADFVVDAVRYLRQRPELVIAAGVALVIVQPGRAWRWGRRVFVGWQAWRRLRLFLDRPPAAR